MSCDMTRITADGRPDEATRQAPGPDRRGRNRKYLPWKNYTIIRPFGRHKIDFFSRLFLI
jgi:hypothetical protein